MDYLSRDLDVFSKATQYTSLSAAAAHVGLGQPQLSRIVAKLEDRLGLILLDRQSRRKSAWTPAALQLAHIYHATANHFRTEINALVSGMAQRELRVGTLEGLIAMTVDFCQAVLAQTNTTVVNLLVLDYGTLEKMFLHNDLDLIFVAREISAKKFRNIMTVGYQSLDETQSGDTMVYSLFEYHAHPQTAASTTKTFVSNSLAARVQWFDRHGGHGTLPSPLRPRKSGKSLKNEVTVQAMAHDTMPVAFWNELKTLLKCVKS